MRLFCITCLLFAMTLTGVTEHQEAINKPTLKEFNELILGSWEMTEVSVNGHSQIDFYYRHKQMRFESDTMFYLNPAGYELYETWEFYESNQSMIFKRAYDGVLYPQRLHYATSDSLQMETESWDGLRVSKWMKLK